MGKIGDLWVRLGLKKDEYTAGLKQADKEAKSFGSSVSAIGGKAKIAFAAVATAVIGVINLVKDLAKQNQSLGDAWNRMTAGMTAAWDVFKTSLAATDFSNLLSNMREASRLARDLYDALDAMGEINTAYNIASSEQLERINELRVRLQDANLTEKERLAAGEELLEIYRKLEKEPTRGLGNVKDKTLDYYMQQMGISMEGYTDEELAVRRKKYIEFFKWLGTAQGEAYNAEAQKVARQLLGADSKLGQEFMRKAANNGVGEFARLAIAYNDKISDKDRAAVESAVVAYNNQVAKYGTETRRIQTLMNSVRHQGAGGGGSAVPEIDAETDAYKAQLDVIRQESAELREIREADEALAAEGDAMYEAWRKAADLPPIQPFDNELLALFEKGNQELGEFWGNLDKTREKSEEVGRAITENLVSAIEDGLVGSFDALSDVMAGVTDGGMEQVVKALLEPLADMAIKAGTLILMSGTAVEALKESLVSFFGGSAIVAGAALIGVGVAAKAGLAAIGNKGSGATSVTSYGGSSAYGAGTGAGTLSAELTVNVRGVVKGSDIILSGQNTLNEWNR